MSEQTWRNAAGGTIDRSRPLAFTFDGRRYDGYEGDTLASALLANGVRLIGRSFKYHRPRGLVAAGVEEPNGLVQVGEGATSEPNVRATQLMLFDGLSAWSQNRWPSAQFDLGEVSDLFARFLPAGFYYKTFMWPRSAWMFYERFIRHAAGLGQAPREPSNDRYEKRYAHCDVLVVGGGPAGLAAALAAGRTGARVMLVDERPDLGGALQDRRGEINGLSARDWVAQAVGELQGLPETALLRRTTVFGYYDHNVLGAVEQLAGPGSPGSDGQPRERLWHVYVQQVVLTTGAIERPLVFANNDRPGVMLASAAQAYANRFAVRPGRRAVVFTNNDSAYQAAADLTIAGVEVAAVVDLRESSPAAALLPSGIPVRYRSAVVTTRGRRQIRAVEVMRLADDGQTCVGEPEPMGCELLCVSGGWSPLVHLHAQSRACPHYDREKAAFVPGPSVQAERSAGAARGSFKLAECLAEGAAAGAAAAKAAGYGDGTSAGFEAADEPSGIPLPVWEVPAQSRDAGKRFVDLQTDVTTSDIALAVREGYTSVEHVKRYTTLGMGTDQGKTSNINGLTILAAQMGQDLTQAITTTFRPPYTPVSFGAIAGGEVGERLDPIQRTPMHHWHEWAGALFMPAGLWLRPRCYPRAGESLAQAIRRETLAVRQSAGLVDVSTLGKIELEGPDAAELLDRVYINGWKGLRVGRARYGVMLREDGVIFDDGTTTRLSENRYLMTTTSGGAARVMAHIEFHLQMVWPDLRVYATSVTDQWAAMALAGPSSREVLKLLAQDLAVDSEALPFMGYAEGRVAGIPARIFRISFSGELGYEINVPAHYGPTAWQALMHAGAAFGITCYGVEAMDVLRIEKGHLVGGAEIDGRTTPYDLGLERMVSTKKDFIGRGLLRRPAFHEPGRERLVGLRVVRREASIPVGAQLVCRPEDAGPGARQGRVTSNADSPTLGYSIALALLANGSGRRGERLFAVSPLTGESAEVEVTDPTFVDPEGTRLRA